MAVLLVTLMQDGDPAFRFFMYICFATAGAGIGFGLRSLSIALSHASSASGPKMAPQRPEPIPNFNNASWCQVYALLSEAKKRVDVSILHLTDRRMVQILLQLRQRGVEIRVALGERQTLRDPTVFWIIDSFWKAKIPLRPYTVIFEAKLLRTGAFDHDYLVIDEEVVIAGSLGSSRVVQALFDDQEETVIIREPKSVRGYRKCFQRTWDKNPQSLFDLYDA